MFRRRDRAAPEPPPVMTMPRPPWLTDDDPCDDDIPHGVTNPDTPGDLLDHPLDPDPRATEAESESGRTDGTDPATGAGAGEVRDACPIDAGEAAQVAVCWAIDHLSADPDAPGRRVEFAVPGAAWHSPDDPAAMWVDLRVLVTLDPPADPAATGSAADGDAPDTTPGGEPPERAAGKGRGRGWDRLPSSRPDRQWWRAPVAVRRCGCGCGQTAVDRELTGRYVAVDAPAAGDTCDADKATEGDDSDVD
jgi:hypothetical protein